MKITDGYPVKTEYYVAERIVAENNCENPLYMLEERPRQVVLFGKQPNLVIKKGGWIILDFSVELQGGVVITLPEIPGNTHLRIVFGESVSEAMSSVGEKNATNDHSIRDITLPVTSWQTFRAGSTGFRFVKLESVDNDINISGVQAVSEYREAVYRGEFECNDELLNQIWKMGAYTVQLNMQEYIWDGIKRDRLVWVGDMHPEVSTVLSVFGDNEIIRKSLDFISENTPANEWMNGIPSYNLWWLKIQYDYYVWSGDTEYVKKQEQYIIDMTKHLLSHISSDGVHDIDFMFIEWNACDTEYEKAGFQAMLKIALDSAGKLLEILKIDKLSKRCVETAEAVKKHIYPYSGNKQVASVMSLADMVDAEEISSNVIKPGNEHGISTFWGFYTLQALSKSGDTDAALNIIRNYWGKMIELGATTFWEDFDVEWAENAGRIDELVPDGKKDIHGDFGKFCYTGFRHSLCHGWASGPTAYMSKQILGVDITEAGCRKIRIKPDLGGLKWVKGKFPTPYGEVFIEHISEDGNIKTTVNAPKAVEVTVECADVQYIDKCEN